MEFQGKICIPEQAESLPRQVVAKVGTLRYTGNVRNL